MLSGDDALTLPLLAIGGSGVISTASNVAPARDGGAGARLPRRRSRARAALHYRLLPLFEALFCETNPIPVKAALALQRPHPRRAPAAAHAALAGESRAPAGRAEGAGARLMSSAAPRCSSSARCGRMGERVRAALADEPSLRLGRARSRRPVTRSSARELAPGVRVRDDAKAALADCDVAIDFSHPGARPSRCCAAAAERRRRLRDRDDRASRGDERAELGARRAAHPGRCTRRTSRSR